MKKYVWLNPVVLNLYDGEQLEYQLNLYGFETVTCDQDHIAEVKRKYEEETEASSGCVMDMRCPKAVEYIKTNYPLADVRYPSIHPILIHSALELEERYRKMDMMLYITTPCKDLSRQGNGLGLSRTEFIPWNDFMTRYGIHLEKKHVKSSPIPPGFFSEYGEAVLSLAKREALKQCFDNEGYRGKKLVEMLYCTNGCHRGDGVDG